MNVSAEVFMIRRLSSLALLLVVAACSSNKPADDIYVPSPDWRDQVIYFVMTDRFFDGNSANNSFGEGEFDQTNKELYSGGDFAGVLQKLDYIEGLGVTSLWVTPPVANQWYDPQVQVGGYHGYWARNFMTLDEHLGTVDDYRAVSQSLHKRGMYLVQDIVTNHVGNFFEYDPKQYDPADPTKGWSANTNTVPWSTPTMSPFDRNDPNVAANLVDPVYHWTPAISDYANDQQRLTYQLSSLDDLNTSSTTVRSALKEAYGYWIRQAGVDAFRIDTIRYVEHDFWHDFMHAPDGMLAVAKALGKDDFFAFGEDFVNSQPKDAAGDQDQASYFGTDSAPELPSVLNFPLYFTIREVFSEGRPTDDLTYRLNLQKQLYKDTTRLVNFIENHDVGRFRARATGAKTQEALLLLMTLPGIPVVYYGSEQDFIETRASMFGAGWGGNGYDHFATSSPAYSYMKSVVKLRRDNPVFARGDLTVIADQPKGPGLFAFKRTYQNSRAIALFNSSDRPIVAVGVDTGLPAGEKLTVALAPGFTGLTQLVVDASGKLTLELPAESAVVALDSGSTTTVTPGAVTLAVTAPSATQTITGDLQASGTASPKPQRLEVVLDGYVSTVAPTVDASGNWTATIPAFMLGNGESDHTIAVYAPGENVVSPIVPFHASITLPVTTATVTDPVGDDKGLSQSYTLPTDPSFGHQMDITSVKGTAVGNALTVDVTLAQVTTVWNPQNGFDHVCFHVFIQLPGVNGGATVLPKLNDSAPGGMTWNRVAFADGWHSSLYSSDGATSTAYGNPVVPAPGIKVLGNTVSFSFPPAALGNVPTLSGAKIYVTTWDYDGVQNVLRPLAATAGPYVFGGGDGAVDPLIIDDTQVLVLP
jgi:glycosidase